MTSYNKPTYTIVFFTTGVELEYSHILTKAVIKVAKEFNVNVINFLGGSLNPEFTLDYSKYQYQYNVAFDYAHTDTIDGIILASGVLSSFLSPKAFSDFYSKYSPLPMVSLGTYIKSMPSVYTDNKQAFKNIVSHLIKVHNKKSIAFITGPSSNRDALDRYAGYIDALAEHGIACNPDLIHIGDFTPDSAIEAIRIFFDEKKLPIDAIVCANDSMALSALSELQKRYITVPDTIALTGFDNIPSTAYSVPSLSSVEQPFEAFAREAFRILLDLIMGKEAFDKLIPSQLIFRESCGCHMLNHTPMSLSAENTAPQDRLLELATAFITRYKNYLPSFLIEELTHFVYKCYELVYVPTAHPLAYETFIALFMDAIDTNQLSIQASTNFKTFISLLKKELFSLCEDPKQFLYIDNVFESMLHKLFNDILKYYGMQTDAYKNNFSSIRQILLRITYNVHDKKEQLHAFMPELINCGVNSCIIYLYPEEIVHNLSDSWIMPNNIYPCMGFINKEILDIPYPNLPIRPTEIIHYSFSDAKEPYAISVHPIFFGNEQLGIIVLELLPENYYLIETLTVEIGCALKLASVFASQKSTESKLEKLSQTDDLTGLLNRRGFFSHAMQRYYIAKAQGSDGILFFADMDGLKHINDTYGHHEGDSAIKAMAIILKQTFAQIDIISRIGGDEFTILCMDKPISFIENVRVCIQHLCESYNTLSNKPYTLSISLGALPFSHDLEVSLESLLSKADKLLYEEKNKRKGCHPK